MLGKQIRSLQHLYRASEVGMSWVVAKVRSQDYYLCAVYKFQNDPVFGERAFLFNNFLSYGSISFEYLMRRAKIDDDEKNTIESNFKTFIEIDRNGGVTTDATVDRVIVSLTLLPKSFESDFSRFITSNKKIGQYLDTIGLSTQNVTKVIFALCNGSKNYFQWAMDIYRNGRLQLQGIDDLMNWAETYPQLIKELSKNTITAYKSRDQLEILLSQTKCLRFEKRVNDVINSFNTIQKKALKAATLSEKSKKIISHFSRLSDTKKRNFIRKMSTVSDVNEILRQMGFMVSAHFDWNKESLMEYLTNVDDIYCEKVFEKGDVLILKVNDFDTIRRLGKNTNWCISKNKQYWNGYMENGNGAKQYMIFDFSKKEDDNLSIIGFTTNKNKGITDAHNFTNGSIMVANRDDSDFVGLDSYISYLIEPSHDIFSLLHSYGFNIKTILDYDKELENWDKGTVLKKLFSVVGESNVSVLCDNGSKVAISVTSNDLFNYFGRAYTNNIMEDWWNYKHIIFFDFSKENYDASRMYVSIIGDDTFSSEEICVQMCDANFRSLYLTMFESLIIEYGLPFDIIKRTDDPCSRMKVAFLTYNIDALSEFFKDKDIVNETFDEYLGMEEICGRIQVSLNDKMSFSLINMFYDNGYTIGEFVEDSYLITTFIETFRKFSASGIALFPDRIIPIPSNEDKEKFFNKRCSNTNEAFYVGLYYAIKLMLEKEFVDGNQSECLANTFCLLLDNINGRNIKGDAVDSFVKILFKKVALDSKAFSKFYNSRKAEFKRYVDKTCMDSELLEIVKKSDFFPSENEDRKKESLGIRDLIDSARIARNGSYFTTFSTEDLLRVLETVDGGTNLEDDDHNYARIRRANAADIGF